MIMITMSFAQRRLATHIIAVSLAFSALSAMPVVAQVSDQQDMALQPLPSQTPTAASGSVGRLTGSVVGVVGQRQARGQEAANIQPMARIANRIEGRVQNRFHNRIDRNYDPQANAASPFASAEDQVRSLASRRR